RAAFGLAAAFFAASLAFEAKCEDASPWQHDAHSAVRLLAGSRSGGVLLGGIAIQLQDGWKTYWRSPGDSGVPPRFDFSKSDNVDDPSPLTIRDDKRDGDKNVLVDVSAPEAKEVSLYVEGPTPDWALPIPKLMEHSPPGVKRFVFELDGLPPGAKPDGAALKF